jgi:hypothetical protein
MLAFTISTILALAPPTTVAPEPTSTAAEAQPPIGRRFGGFVGAEWRVMGIGGHVSHGPGFQAGAIFFDHLAIGVAGIARPGPINPATFSHDLPAGQTYKGKSTLHLRSDGNTLGLLVAPFYDFRRAPLSLELPIMIGYGGFGFYLHGDDRKVPDDRRVSDWENELFDGRDSDPVNLVIDLGVRLSFTPRRARTVRVHVGVHYMWVPGFDTAVRANYDGVSGVLGIKFGKFPKR